MEYPDQFPIQIRFYPFHPCFSKVLPFRSRDSSASESPVQSFLFLFSGFAFVRSSALSAVKFAFPIPAILLRQPSLVPTLRNY